MPCGNLWITCYAEIVFCTLVEACLSAARGVKPARADDISLLVVRKNRRSDGRYRRSRQEPGDVGEPVVGEVDGAQLAEQFGFRVVMTPTAGLKKFNQMGFAALDQGEPIARNYTVRTWLLDRHGSPERPRHRHFVDHRDVNFGEQLK
jgi:hypothetical protein